MKVTQSIITSCPSLWKSEIANKVIKGALICLILAPTAVFFYSCRDDSKPDLSGVSPKGGSQSKVETESGLQRIPDLKDKPSLEKILTGKKQGFSVNLFSLKIGVHITHMDVGWWQN